MIKRDKPTVSIGIPAYNEEGNIAQLLYSILNQRQTNYTLHEVIVVCDGCTDSTAKIVSKFVSTYQQIQLVAEKERHGKAHALNKIHKSFNGDFLMTIDADLVLVGERSLNHMIEALIKNKDIDLVGPRHISLKPKSLMGKFAYMSYVSFEDAFLKINNGSNFYGMIGVGMMRRKLAKSFTYPKGTISDQCYLYAQATRNNKHGFKLVKEAKVLFRPVSTFLDWRLLGMRSVIGDKEDVAKHFGKEILKEFSMPKKLYIMSLLKWFMKSPILTTGAILMNIYIRKFPYRKTTPKNGMWETTSSSKIAISIDN